jgi:hypothetical protein
MDYQDIAKKEGRKREEAKNKAVEVFRKTEGEGWSAKIDGWVDAAETKLKELNEKGDLSPEQKYVARVKYFREWGATEAYMQLMEEKMSPDEMKLVNAVCSTLVGRQEELGAVVDGSLEFKRQRMVERGSAPGVIENEIGHISRVTEQMKKAYLAGEATPLGWLAAVLHDEKKQFMVNGKPMALVGPHELFSALDAEDKAKKVLTEVFGCTDDEASAAAKYVKLVISRHGRNEFPLIRGKADSEIHAGDLRGSNIIASRDDAYVVPGKAYLLWGYPVYDMTSEGIPIVDGDVGKDLAAKAEKDAYLLNGKDLMDGCRVGSFVKYHDNTPLEGFYGLLYKDLQGVAREDNYFDGCVASASVVGSFAESYRNNLLGCHESVRQQLVDAMQTDLVRAGLLLRLTEEFASLREGSKRYEDFRTFMGQEVFDEAMSRLKRMGEICAGTLKKGVMDSRVKADHWQEFQALVTTFSKLDLSDGRENSGRILMLQSMDDARYGKYGEVMKLFGKIPEEA